MKRLDCLKAIYPQLEDCAVVTIMVAVAAELYPLGVRANFFCLEQANGVALTIVPGTAPTQPKHEVFVNDALLSVGGGAPGGSKWSTTATSAGTDLAGIAKAA